MTELRFHRLVPRDLRSILNYYDEEAGVDVGDRFYRLFLETASKALSNPRHFHPLEDHPRLRRANLPDFPYHFLYRETDSGIRLLVLRHHKRNPSFGMQRR